MNYIAELTWFKNTKRSSFGYTKQLFDIIENIVNLNQFSFILTQVNILIVFEIFATILCDRSHVTPDWSLL